MEPVLIRPDWPVAHAVQASATTRAGGVSQPPFDSLNLGAHVGDYPQAVDNNRQRLLTLADLPGEPLWLQQVHGNRAVDAGHWQPGIEADAIYTDEANQVCAVLTADCLPVLFTDRTGSQVAAAHAGWRGLLAGILENTVARFSGRPEAIQAWLGPAIGPQQFEVGDEVFETFTAENAEAEQAFTRRDKQHFLADIYQLARQRLARVGVNAVFGGQYCTVTDSARFFSYRRDGKTGRMASLIWINPK